MDDLPASTSEFDQFFKALARRLRNETHLSDITYTAIELIPEFKKDFIRYFFEDLNANEEIEVRRESRMPSGAGQPDFVFRAESWDLIVENKIWDDNYHFEQYRRAPLQPGRPLPYVGLIANHRVPLPETLTWQFRHWMNFVDKFSEKHYGQFHPVFVAYLCYVKEICTIAEFKNFRFEPKSLFALTHFVRMAERVLQNTSGTSYELTVKPTHKWGFGDSWAGHWFELKATNSEKTLNLFFGVDFGDESKLPAILVSVHKFENPSYFRMIEKAALKSPSFEIILRKEDEIIQLQMPAGEFNSLNVDPSRENQLSTLCSFLTACCDALLKSVD
jgi:hypothetical protein